MRRVVLDTNVLVSALVSPFGNPAQVLQAVQQSKIKPCLSREIIEEYKEVLARPKFNFAPHEIDGLIELLRANGLMLNPAPAIGASPDPGDDDFIACALAADAEFLVTGNKRHFPAQSCGQTKVVSARELLEIVNTLQSL